MHARRILETCLYVDDLIAAERFYTAVLGLERLSAEANRHVFFKCENGVFLLFNPEETPKSGHEVPTHGTHGPGHVAFAMRDADVKAWKEQLERNGIEIEMLKKWDNGGISIYFRDPAGNSVELATDRIWERADDT